MSSKVFWIFFYQIKIPKRKQNAETFFQHELLLYVLLFIIKFYDLNLSLKSLIRIKSLTLKRFRVK